MRSPHDRKLWSMRFIEREPVRFVLAGGVNTATTYAAYLLLLPLIGYALAFTVSFAAGIFFAYYLSARLVFRRPLEWRRAVQYPLVYVLQYGLGITLTTALVEGAHVNPEFAPPLVIVITLPFTFWLSRRIITRGKKNEPTDPPNSERGANTSVPGTG
jgi:putative flippase GtrA